MRRPIDWLAGLLVSLIVGATAQGGMTQWFAGDWDSVSRELGVELRRRGLTEREPSPGAKELPTDLEGLLKRLQLAALAGRDGEVLLALQALGRFEDPEDIRRIEGVAYFFVRREDWDNARGAFEYLPRCSPHGAHRLWRHMAESMELEEVDTWLERQSSRSPLWLREWVRFRQEYGDLDELMGRLRARVEEASGVASHLEDYLEALKIVGPERDDLAWLPGVVDPLGALARYRLGEELSRIWHAVARHYLELSVETKLTEAEREELRQRVSRPFFGPYSQITMDQYLYQWNARALARVCRELGDAESAQFWLEALNEASPDGLAPGFLLEAGQIQSMSGARVIEQKVLSKEDEGAEDASYWLGRAAYYFGRQELEEEHRALSRALELGRLEGGMQLRRARNRWVGWLSRTEGEPSAAAFLLAEAQAVGAGSDEVASILGKLLDLENDYKPSFDPDREMFWEVLAARTEWERFEELLVWAMARHVIHRERGREPSGGESEALNGVWSRAEALAKDGARSRAAMLGWVMTRCGADQRALPWLESSLERSTGVDQRHVAAWTLSEAYLATGAWRQARKLEADLGTRMSAIELAGWRTGLVIAAARADELAEALELWAWRGRLDRADLRALEDLAELGLTQLLVGYYEQMAREDPASSTPDRALELLR